MTAGQHTTLNGWYGTGDPSLGVPERIERVGDVSYSEDPGLVDVSGQGDDEELEPTKIKGSGSMSITISKTIWETIANPLSNPGGKIHLTLAPYGYGIGKAVKRGWVTLGKIDEDFPMEGKVTRNVEFRGVLRPEVVGAGEA